MFLGSNLAIISQNYEIFRHFFQLYQNNTNSSPGRLGRLPCTIDAILQDIQKTVQILSKVSLL